MIVQGIEVAEWVMTKSGGNAHQHMSAIGWVRDKKLVAGVAFENWTGTNLTVHQRHDAPCTKSFWKAVADYCFVKSGCRRITGPVGSTNEKAIRLNKKIGFEVEATLKEAGKDGEDILLMVLWKQNCRFLNWK